MSSNNSIQFDTLPPYLVRVTVIALASLVIKFMLLPMNEGEYTDGIIQLQLWNSPIVFFPPGYTALVSLAKLFTHDWETAGRVVSILASTATLFVVFFTAFRTLENKSAAVGAVIFLALSPVFNRWSMRVMTDSLFCLMFMICTHILLEILNRKKYSVFVLIFATGAAVLVRYQGLFFVPFIALILHKQYYKESNPLSAFDIIQAIVSLIPWVLMGAWIVMHGFGHVQQFTERASNGFLDTAIGYWMMFETYILYFPWAVTYLLFLCGMVGCFMLWKGVCSERRFIQFSIAAFIVFLGVQSCFRSFQYRYLLPLIPLWCIAGAQGMAVLVDRISQPRRKRYFAIAVCANLLIVTTAVLSFQRSTFGDIKASAEYLQYVWQDARVVSTEMYGNHAANIKLQFWSGREIAYLNDVELHAGDLVVLNNVYPPVYQNKSYTLEEFMAYLKDRFQVTTLYQTGTSGSDRLYITMPLLPDIMVNPKFPLTSNPECMAFRFLSQAYYSAVLRLEEKP